MEPMVLYVDDDIDNLDLFRLRMSEAFDVAVAEQYTEAVRFLETKNVGVALIDHRMPGMLGGDLAALMRHAYPTIPRILTSAYVSKEDSERIFYEADLFAFVKKPWEHSELHKILQLALNHHNTLVRANGFSVDMQSIYRKMLTTRANLDQATNSCERAIRLLGKHV